jgi:prepilin-type N-terminal cleavage/methylation domain-containing protein
MKSPRTSVASISAARAAFSLFEIMVAVAVLAILTVLVAQLTNSVSALTRVGVKHIGTDTQARAVLDRIGVDISKMIKRSDLDYYIKQPTGYNGHGQGHGWGTKLKSGQQGNDQCAFFALLPGYYTQSGGQSPVSLVAYRVNQNSGSAAYLQLERMAKGLLWNGVSNDTNANSVYPIVFLPNTISGISSWSAAVNNDASGQSIDPQGDYETVGPQVFRMEYWYLLTNGTLTDVPWDKNARPAQTTMSTPTPLGWTDVQAIAVAIAVIDPASRSLIPSATLLDIASDLDDFKTAPGRGAGGAKKAGDMEYRWNTVLFGGPSGNPPGIVNTGQTTVNSRVPPAVASAIRVYSRYFDLRAQ